MINVVNFETHYNDERKIVTVEVKLKSLKTADSEELHGHPLLATVSAAFFKTTLLADVGKNLKTTLCPERDNIVDLTVNLKESDLTVKDVANFIAALQSALDSTKLF